MEFNITPITSERANQIYSGNSYRFYEDWLLPNCDKNGDEILTGDEIYENFMSAGFLLKNEEDGKSYISGDNFVKQNSLEDDFASDTVAQAFFSMQQSQIDSDSWMKDENLQVYAEREKDNEKIKQEVNDAISFFANQFPNLEKYFNSINTYYFSNGASQEELEKANVPAILSYATNNAGVLGGYSVSDNKILVKLPSSEIKGADSEYNPYYNYGNDKGANDSLALRTILAHEVAHSLDFATVDENGHAVYDSSKKDTNYGGFSNSPAFADTFKEECDSLGLSDMSYLEIIKASSKFKGAQGRSWIAYAATQGNDEAFASMVEALLNPDYKYVDTIYKNFPKTLAAVKDYLNSLE